MITFTKLLKRAETKRVAIHTITEEQAKELLKALDKKGYTWFVGQKLTDVTFYADYEENTCYSLHANYKIPSIKKVMYCPLNHYQKYGYTIIKCGDIDFKEN